jgi:hypothetical protein
MCKSSTIINDDNLFPEEKLKKQIKYIILGSLESGKSTVFFKKIIIFFSYLNK